MQNNLNKIDQKSKVLFKNTVMLYAMQFSTYLFSFITVPYQTRVLKPELYGRLGVAVAMMTYFQLFMDFGFLLSATEDVSKNRDDKNYICARITSVAVIKLIFMGISCLVMLVLCFTVPVVSEDKTLYFLYLLAYAVNSFLPDYIYRGLEKMTAVTIRTLIIKFFFCIMIFVFLKKPSEYLLVPLMLLIGNIGAVVGAYIHLFKTMGYRFVKVTISDIRRDLKRSSFFFYSKIASTVYTATNTVILGMIDQSNTTTGFYTAADRGVSTAKSAFFPISDSLYPYMIRNRDFKIVKKILMIAMPILILGCGIVFVFAEPLCVLIFGKEYAPTATVLRMFIPGVIAIFPRYILSYPTLGAMGISKYANYAMFIGMAVHLAGLVIMALFGAISAVTLAAMTSISEWAVLIYIICIIIKNARLMPKS